jgi:predicted SprT family Zn-dependent metalloprotease
MSSAHKQKKREEMKKLLQQVKDGIHPYGRRWSSRWGSPYQDVCFSQTCHECGRVWISAVRAIKPNARRGGRRVYICGNCR